MQLRRYEPIEIERFHDLTPEATRSGIMVWDPCGLNAFLCFR